MTEQTDASAHRVIGIDFGTTSCAVSVWDGTRAVVVPSAAGEPFVPSIVGQNQAGQVLVGRVAAGDPETAITGVKRELGTGEGIRFRGRLYQPREICAFLLLELKRQAEAFLGATVHDAVITVPSSMAEGQLRALREAAGLAQLNVRRFLHDPLAAAVGFGGDGRVRTYAIYDLGGGTFDASVVRIGPGVVEILGAAGDARLGGDDFDERIVGFALRQIRDRHHVDLGLDELIRHRIRREAELRKRELSVAESTVLELPTLTATVSASVPLTRRAFEAMIEDDVDRTLVHLEAALTASHAAHGVGPAEIEQVLLAGGSSRIPLIRDRLADYFGLGRDAIRADLDPDELLARGAGLIAREFEPAPIVEGPPLGLFSASLRLRSEMADPDQVDLDPPVPQETGPPGALPKPPAETPADFRPIADLSHDLLARSTGDHDALRGAYHGFVEAIRAAADDARLTELGENLAAEYREAD